MSKQPACELSHLHHHDSVAVKRVGRPDFLLPRWVTASDAVVFAAAELAWDERLNVDRMHTTIRNGAVWIDNDEEVGNG